MTIKPELTSKILTKRQGFPQTLSVLKVYFLAIAYWIVSFPILHPRHRPFALRLLGLRIGRGARIESQCLIQSRKISVGDNFSCNVGCYFEGHDGLTIHDEVSIGAFVRIMTTTHAIMPSKFRRDKDEQSHGPVVIQDGVWIGTGAIILPGVTIAEGCVIGAGAVVIESTEPHGLYAGVPAVRKKELPLETDRVFLGGKIV